MSRKRTSIIWTLEKDKLQELVTNSLSISSIVRHLGFSNTSSAFKMLYKRFKEDNIDYSHIKLGLNSNSGRRFNSKAIPLDMVTTVMSTYSRSSLKKRLLINGTLKNECSICHQGGEWNGKKINMILDHINGVRDDNRIENLRMVCPNCNSQLSTSNGKRHKKIYHCRTCGKSICKNSTQCKSCVSKNRKRKVENRPSKLELEIMISEIPMTKIGSKYGVSDNTIRKWCRIYHIVIPKRRGSGNVPRGGA